MNSQSPIRKSLIISYVTVFFVACLVRIYNGHWMSIQQPVMYSDSMNLVTWFFRLSGWLDLIHNNVWLAVLLDLSFIAANIFIPVMVGRKPDNRLIVFLLCLNFIYTNTSAAMALHTMETQLSWLVMPILFFHTTENRWLVIFSCLRYLFLFIFFSAAAWKITRGAVFNTDQMQSILLSQHRDLLAVDPGWSVSKMITWLINNPMIAQAMYITVAVAELVFIIGFFTFRFDIWLFVLYVVFILADILFMRILFGETLAFATILLFSKPVKQLINRITPLKAYSGS